MSNIKLSEISNLIKEQIKSYKIDVVTENLGELEIKKLSYFLPCGFRI